MSDAGIQLRAALLGNFEKEQSEALKRVEAAVQAAIFEYAEDLKNKWRQDVASSGLRNAQKLIKTIRLRNYKNRGLDPAAQVFSTFPIIQHAFEAETIVKSRDGGWILIPNPEVWPTGRVPVPSRNGGRRTNTVALAEQRFGPLRFIYNPKGASMLVTDARRSKTRAGVFRYASATAHKRGNVTEIVVFFLVKQARLPRMLRGSVLRERARKNAAREIDRLFVRYFDQDAGPRLLTGPSND